MQEPEAGKKKIATLTFHNCDNYGAVLQAYALQQILIKMGADTEIIDYRRDNFQNVARMFLTKIRSTLSGRPDRQLYSVREFLKMVLFGEGNTKDMHESFVKFRKENLICSRPVDRKTIGMLEGQYDYIVAGSDQIWNCGRVSLEPAYMLDFVADDSKKISYAASFGITEIPEKYMDVYKCLLSKFSHISVREKQGALLVKQLTGKDAAWVLDPTFLLSREDWMKAADMNAGKGGGYILVYYLGESDGIQKIAGRLSQKTELPVRYVRKQKTKKDPHAVAGCSPSEWLGLFLNADYIITSSFHGAAFSINFNKQFYAVRPEDRIRGAMQSRLKDILERTGLENRYIQTFSEIDLKRPVAYGKVNCIMEDLRKKSEAYLREVLFQNEDAC